MWNALMWGAISGSAVLLGALIAAYFKIPKKVIGWVMAFGTGTLIGATSFELLEDAIDDGGLAATAIGFLVGAVVYTIFDLYVSSKGGANRKRSYHNHHGSHHHQEQGYRTAEQQTEAISKAKNDTREPSSQPAKQNSKNESGLGIFAGTVMDGIPESIMIGASLLTGQGVSAVLVVSIFISNIPEGLSSTIGMQQSGFSRRKIFVMWITVLIISALASMLGYVFLEMMPDEIKAGIGAFAGGGIIAMLCSTMAPEAYKEGGPIVGLIASMGLLAALVLSF